MKTKDPIQGLKIRRIVILTLLIALLFIPIGFLVDSLYNQPTWEVILAARDITRTQAITPLPEPSPTGPGNMAIEKTTDALLPSAQAKVGALVNAPHYTIALDLNQAEHTFKGQANITITNTEITTLDSLFFRLLPNGGGSFGDGALSISEVTVANQPTETLLSQNDTVLEIVLPNTLEPGQSIQVDLDFAGTVPVDYGANSASTGYGIYNYTDGVTALAGWYPILAVYDADGWNLDPVSSIGDSVYSDIAFYSVKVTAPGDLAVAATGAVIEEQDLGDKTTYRFESGPARDFFLISSPDFRVASRDVEGTLINSYYLPRHLGAGQMALNVAADSLQIFNDRFGDYPYAELDVIDAPMNFASGVEFPGIILIRSSLYEQPNDPTFTIVIAHEVAHQWWYNVVGNDVFDEPWLDEALTTYSSSLYYEFGSQKTVPTGLVEYWQSRYDDILQFGTDYAITQSLEYFEGLENSSAYSSIVYNKGALFFKALREEIGDPAFFEALQTYYRDFGFQIATGEDLLAAFEAAAGRQLDDFYQEWLY